jgi:hypothetical protein
MLQDYQFGQFELNKVKNSLYETNVTNLTTNVKMYSNLNS